MGAIEGVSSSALKWFNLIGTSWLTRPSRISCRTAILSSELLSTTSSNAGSEGRSEGGSEVEDEGGGEHEGEGEREGEDGSACLTPVHTTRTYINSFQKFPSHVLIRVEMEHGPDRSERHRLCGLQVYRPM